MPPAVLASVRPPVSPIEDTTRREFITGIGAAALAAAFLAACGSEDDPAEATPGGDVRRIELQFGTTEISGIPQRVVTVGWTEQDALLALGVVPVGTTQWVGDHPGAIHPWAADEVGDAPLPEVLSDSDGIQFEQIAALDPDLILALYVPFGLMQEDYERLSEIAPTVAPPAGVPEGGISWQDLTRTVGVAVGQADAAARIVDEVDGLFARARADHPEFVGALGLNAYPSSAGTYQAYPPPDPGGRLLTDLGFVVPQPIVDLADGAAWVDLSSEQVSLFDIDVMLWLVEDGAARDRLLADPLYSGLTVAREGRHVIYSYAEEAELAAACSMQTVLSLPFLLEHLVPQLAAALDGDPATV